MKKQDINGVRSAQDLERKYDLKSILKLKENFELQKNGLNKVENELTEFVIATTNNLQEIQNQVDGNITTWFLSGVPTLNNEPTINWNTIEEKNNHLGDLYYDKETGYSYRFTVENEIYEWIKLTDSDITEALAIANSAKDTADSKRRVFVVQPIPPYDVGDLWINNEELYRCQTTKGKEEIFENNDWIVATKYTDDTVANQVGENLTILSGTVTEIRKDVDKLDTTMINTTELVNEQGKKVGLLEEKQSQTTQTVDEITSSVNHLNQTVNKIQTITNTLEGNPIKIENALENPLQKLVITGDGEITNDILKVYRKNEQLDYPEIEMKYNPESKNLFDLGDSLNNYFATSTNGTKINTSVNIEDYVSATFTENSITITKYNNSGYRWLSKQINLKKNTTYTISGQNSNIVKVLGFSSLEEGTISIQLAYIDNQNLTPPKSFNSGNYEFYVISMYPPTNTTISNLQIEEGPIATEYVPYNKYGGQYYLDGISTQTTKDTKNLLNNILQSQTINGVTFTVNEDKSITLNGTSTQEFYPRLTNNFKLENKDYTLSTVEETEDSKIKIVIRQSAQNVQIVQLFNGNAITFNNTYLYDVFIYLVIRENQTFNNFTIYPMLEEGTIATQYEPYSQTPSPTIPSSIVNTYKAGTYQTVIENKLYTFTLNDDLQSVGDVADRLWLDIANNIAEVEKKIGKIVLNGSENWQEFYMTKTNTNVFSINSTYLNNNYQNSYNKITALSDYFKCYGLGTLYGNDDIEAIELNSNMSYSIQIGISKDIASSVSEFKQWLSETNTEVQYVLSIPLLQTIQMESIYQQYKLNISSLLTLNETKDEYVLENGKAIIIKKIGINENGSKYVLNTPLISDLGQLYIQLANGVNILEFLNNFNMEATYFVDNDFTRKFANQINSSSEFNEQNNLLNQTSTDLNELSNKLNNDYTNNSKLNQLLEGQKAAIIEETSTMVQQSASEVSTRIINKVNTDGVTTLKNTLVTIDINGINVAKNDEDVVSLLDNKGLYVSDGKLKSDESNLLMKTDRNGAYFKSATIDGTIKEQGLFQKEVIIDDDFGKGQAGFWIGG